MVEIKNKSNGKHEPSVVVLLGTAGSGKSTLRQSWQKLYPNYQVVDDLQPLLEYLELDRLVCEALDVQQLRKSLLDFAKRSTFISDIAHDYLKEIANIPTAIPQPRYCRRISDTAMEISSPLVWDDIIVRLGKTLKCNNKYLVEFARGHDTNYLAEFNLTEKEIYPRTLKALKNSLPAELAKGMTIIHVGASYAMRYERNEQRKTLTGQHTPHEVMESVFKREIFFLDTLEQTGDCIHSGYSDLADEHIPLFSIQNDKKLLPADRSSFFDQAAMQAMNHFCSGNRQ